MMASKPLSMLFSVADWRLCFFSFAAAELLCAALVFFVTPKEKSSGLRESGPSFGKMLLEMLRFFGDKRFWFVAPCVTASEAVLFSCLYLWVSPWLRDVAGMNDAQTGVYMLYAFTGAAAGYFLNGVAAEWSNRVKWLSWEKIYFCSGLIMTVLLGVIAFVNARPAAALWGFVFFLSTMTMISFPIVRKLFKAEEIGRAMSLLNFLIFAVSFVFQWFIGVILDFYPSSGGHFSPDGYRLSMIIMTVINAAAVIQLFFGLKKYRDKL
jgi:predicted MFS family arabinose efflux permease